MRKANIYIIIQKEIIDSFYVGETKTNTRTFVTMFKEIQSILILFFPDISFSNISIFTIVSTKSYSKGELFLLFPKTYKETYKYAFLLFVYFSCPNNVRNE